MNAVRRKITGERLSQQDYRHIIADITDRRYSKTEIAAFLVASGQTEMDRDEIFYLTRAMLEVGEQLDGIPKETTRSFESGKSAEIGYRR